MSRLSGSVKPYSNRIVCERSSKLEVSLRILSSIMILPYLSHYLRHYMYYYYSLVIIDYEPSPQLTRFNDYNGFSIVASNRFKIAITYIQCIFKLIRSIFKNIFLSYMRITLIKFLYTLISNNNWFSF